MNFLKNLIGGQIVKGYSISGEAITGVGHHKQWKLYKGKKDSTGTQVSIFVIVKKSIKSNIKEQLMKSVKKEVSSLVKIRHPGVLALIQPLQQDEQFITFVTERVEGNLSSLIRTKKLEDFISSQLQLKLNLFPLLQTVNFLHEIVKLCHLGISLESIYITHEGKWKIGGMNYVQVLTGQDQQSLQKVEFHDYLHLAPQVVNQSKFNKLSDSYSLGILFINFMLLLKKTPHSLMQPAQNKQTYAKHSKSYKDYAQFPAILQSNAPQQLIQLLSQLLVEQPSYRLNVSSLQSSKWVNDPIVLTVKYLQKIANYENKQQVQFLKGLSGVIDKFSGKILHLRIIPNLTNLLKFNHLVASIIFIIIDIMKRNMITVEEWRKSVWTELKPITQGKQMTAQSLYLLISNMEILQKFLTEENFMACIIPLYLKCFDCPPKLKILALKHIQRLTKKYDYQFTKTKIVPKLVNVMKDDKIQIRKDALKALYAIIARLDPLTIVNVVLTGLQNCRKAGADQFISAITVEIYNKITSNMSAQVLATKLMPGLMPYLTDPSIQKEQFGMYKNALLKMINKIEEQRKKTWSQQQNVNAVNLGEKFTEKDFILEKVETQGNGSTGKVATQNEARFDFLNEYKSMASNQNTSNYTQNQQQRSNQQIKLPNYQATQQQIHMNTNGQKQQGGFSFGIQIPQQTSPYQQQGQSDSFTLQQQHKIQPRNNQEITITDYSFGNFDKHSSFDMGFGSSLSVSSNQNNDSFSFGQQNKNFNQQKPSTSGFQFNFGSTNGPDFNNNGFSFQSTNTQTQKVENKQMPFSPSTQQSIPNNLQTKPFMKAHNNDSESKKLIGPGQGGLKKPPKYNQLNMPAQLQSQPQNLKTGSFQFGSSLDTAFSSSSNQPTINLNNSPSLFNQQIPIVSSSFSTPTNQFNLGVSKNDDPFADVQQQYGISSTTMGNMNFGNNNFNFNTNSNNNNGGNLNFIDLTQNNNNISINTNKPKSNDPFDDLL